MKPIRFRVYDSEGNPMWTFNSYEDAAAYRDARGNKFWTIK